MVATLERQSTTARPATDWLTLSAHNLATYWEIPQRSMGRRWTRNEHVWAADSENLSPFPNSAALVRPLQPKYAEEVVAGLKEFFSGRTGGPWLLWSAWETPDLGEYGLKFGGQPPLMVRQPWHALSRPHPVELEVVEVHDAQTATDWLETLGNGFPARELLDPRSPRFIEDRLPVANSRMWVGYVEGRPVSCSAAYSDAFVTGIYAVATLEEFRGHGYGSALCDVAANVDLSLPAVLQASESGYPVYRALGFEPAGTYSIWIGTR